MDIIYIQEMHNISQSNYKMSLCNKLFRSILKINQFPNYIL